MICRTSKDLPSFTSRNSRVSRRTRNTVKFAVVILKDDSTTKGTITLVKGHAKPQMRGEDFHLRLREVPS